MNTTIGLLHPGAMGQSVGAAARESGARVVWASAQRSDQTRARALSAQLEDAHDLDTLVRCSDLIISVCPPSAALQTARSVAELGFAGTYVDANAVSPDTVRALAAVFDADRVALVDGGLIGPPAHRADTTTLHLSGEAGPVRSVAACFAGSVLEVNRVDGPIGAASALKMAFAAYTKGTLALVAAIHAVAREEGVEDEILAEWERRVPEALGRLRAGVPHAATKAWRFAGEMREIAATFAAAGLPDGFHLSAADVYEQLADFKEAGEPPRIEDIADRLRQRS
jgi:3-hydroxyisobutyrate dehydrogenase-like beta-hydroxyacid dehydrogenase